MAPAASVLIPTRGRPAYLAVALASVAPQAAEQGAEVVVVEDDVGDSASAALAAAHGAHYTALGAWSGINVARNTAIAVARGELLCLIDDDVEVWPGWLGALLVADSACPDHEAFGGPIRPRLEGTDLHACGREPPPVTALDLGPADTDAELVWGANLAVRRSALTRIGRFDPSLSGAGDEEDWLRRLRAAGGRIRYVAAAGVDHRRAGADARLGRLTRAAFARGRYARRYDGRKGTGPSLGAESRILVGCVWHIARRRCGNGIPMTAHSLGRIRAALAEERETTAERDTTAERSAVASPDASAPAPPDFLSGESGTLGRRGLLVGAARDRLADLLALPARVALDRELAGDPPRRVLALCVARPEHLARVEALEHELRRSRHAVELRLVAPAPGAGKWANLNAALRASPPAGHDWLLIIDDDVALPARFLDRFIGTSERYGLRLAQPAHAFASHAAWRVTRRRPGAVVHRTRFVEIGPVTALARETLSKLLPFPDLQMGWGLDAHWGAVAEARGWPVGVVDLTPIRHLRPVASDYPREAALAEATAFLSDRPYLPRERAQEALAVHRRIRPAAGRHRTARS